MLRTKICGSICNTIFRNNKTRYRCIKFEDTKYYSRFFTSKTLVRHYGSGKGDNKPPVDVCSKSGGSGSNDASTPCEETALPPPGQCAPGQGPPNKPSLMDQLPIPSANCSWEEQQRRTSYRKNFILLAGILMCVLGAIPTYYLVFNAKVNIPPKKTKVVKDKVRRRPYPVSKDPSNSDDIPGEVQYLLVGGGTASFSAFRAIKSRDPKAQVLVIGDEPYYPYMRPPLTKELFYTDDREVARKLKFKQWNGSERSLFYEPEDFYSTCQDLQEQENGGVAVARGWKVKRIDATNRTAYLENGHSIKYEKCLLATGAKPKPHPVFSELDEDTNEKVLMYRNVFNFLELEDVIQSGEAKKIAVVGGSFLGSELACSLARRGKDTGLSVTQIFRENGNMGKILPEYLSKWTTRKVQKEGVNVMSGTTVEDIEFKNDQIVLVLNTGKELKTDYVVVALGVEPNTDLALISDLETDKELGGFLVNAELEARSNLYAAGDCACFYDAKLGRRRVEHHDHAVVSGRLAGENMTGAGKPYWHQSMFWSDLGPDVGYEAIGVVDSNLPTVGVYAKETQDDSPQAAGLPEDGMRSTAEDEASEEADKCAPIVEEKKEEEKLDDEIKEENVEQAEENVEKPKEETPENYGKGVIFYLRDDVVVGIVLWNIFNRMSIARQVLNENRHYSDLNEVAKLFNIHSD